MLPLSVTLLKRSAAGFRSPESPSPVSRRTA